MKRAIGGFRFSILVAVLALSATLLIGGVAYADPIQVYSDEEIAQRFHEINSSYEVGEPFDSEDATFVLTYGKKPDDPVPYGSHNVSMSGGLYGTNVKVTGSVYHNGTFTYTYGGTLVATKTSGATPKKYVTTIGCIAYGVIGESGIGKIYDGSVSASKQNSNSFTASISKTYNGYMLTYTLEPYVVVTTSSGDVFTIRA